MQLNSDVCPLHSHSQNSTQRKYVTVIIYLDAICLYLIYPLPLKMDTELIEFGPNTKSHNSCVTERLPYERH